MSSPSCGSVPQLVRQPQRTCRCKRHQASIGMVSECGHGALIVRQHLRLALAAVVKVRQAWLYSYQRLHNQVLARKASQQSQHFLTAPLTKPGLLDVSLDLCLRLLFLLFCFFSFFFFFGEFLFLSFFCFSSFLVFFLFPLILSPPHSRCLQGLGI